MNRRRGLCWLVVGLAMGLSLGVTAQAEKVRVVGSDLLGPGLEEAIKEFGRARGMEVEVDFSGSLRARRAMESGQARVALLSDSPGAVPWGEAFSAEPLGYHVAVLSVSRSIDLTELSFSQLREIFGEESRGERRKWRDYGARGADSSRLTEVWPATGHIGMSEALLRFELRLPIAGSVGEEGVVGEAGQTQIGIVIGGRWPEVTDRRRVVAISREQNGRAYMPTAENVSRGHYPLSWPLWLVFRRDEVEAIYPLLRFLLGDEVAKLLDQADLMPLPEALRGERIFELERL